MKLMIVDDEQNICRGIENYLKSMKYPLDEILSMDDSFEAVEAARTFMPDILISDINMPRLNGFDMINQIHAFCPDIQVIIISCLDEIKHLKKAFRINAIDYIFKPVDPNELNYVMEKTIALCQKRIQDAKLTQGELGSIQDRYFVALLAGRIGERDMGEVNFRKIGMKLSRDRRLSVAIIARAGGIFDIDETARICEELNGMPSDGGTLHAFTMYGDIVLLMESDLGASVFQQTACAQAIEHIRSEHGITARCHASSATEGISALPAAYRRAFEANAAHASGRGDISAAEDRGDDPSCGMLPADMTDRFMGTVCYGNGAAVKELIDKCREAFQASPMPEDRKLAVLRDGIASIIDEIQYRMVAIGVDAFKERVVDTDRLKMAGTLNQTLKDLKRILERIMAQYQKSCSSRDKIVDSAKMIIESRYSSEDLNVQYIARTLQISANYLSAVFKHDTGVGLNEFITQRRIEQAKRLLCDKELKMRDICRMIGIADQSYFTRLFRKYCQINPTEYRENAEQIAPNGKNRQV